MSDATNPNETANETANANANDGANPAAGPASSPTAVGPAIRDESTAAALARLAETLAAIESADVRTPDMPMAVFNQQGKDLAAFLERNEAVRERLAKVGVPETTIAGFREAIAAAIEAEGQWQAVYSPRNPDELLALETEAAALREDALAAARWNLRHDRIVQGTLAAIADGDGRADLAQDLDALGVLLAAHADAFAADATFDAPVVARDCRDRAGQLREIVAESRADLSRDDAKAQRDRAFTHADALLVELRSAARYAFRDDASTLAHFRDRYSRRKTARSRRG